MTLSKKEIVRNIRNNVWFLLEKNFKGINNRFDRAVNHRNISRLILSGKTRLPKEETIKDIENNLGLQHGWLEQDHGYDMDDPKTLLKDKGGDNEAMATENEELTKLRDELAAFKKDIEQIHNAINLLTSNLMDMRKTDERLSARLDELSLLCSVDNKGGRSSRQAN